MASLSDGTIGSTPYYPELLPWPSPDSDPEAQLTKLSGPLHHFWVVDRGPRPNVVLNLCIEHRLSFISLHTLLPMGGMGQLHGQAER
jgi:hypothetical protein